MSTATATLRRLLKTLPAESLSTRRAIDRDDVRLCLRKIPVAKRRVRVYSRDGFVPSSYRWRCEIQYVEAARRADGTWHVWTGWTGAQRSRGAGSLVVVQ